MIRYEDALDRLIEARTRLDEETIPATRALGRFPAEEVRSPGPLQPFSNSAMDGFALRTGDEEIPAGTRCEVIGRVAAGEIPGTGRPAADPATSAHPRAWEIMTGAPVPEGFDAVVPVEDVEVEEAAARDAGPRSIRLRAPVAPGQHVRLAGQDFRAGDPVLPPGRRVGPAEVMALAALGIDRLSVLREPRARVLCTGPELVDDASVELEPGRIRNSNGPFLGAYLGRLGVRVEARRTLGDEIDPFLEELRRAGDEGEDLVVSTGAVSMGRHDFVPTALERVGARVLFHRVAIRPGKPVLAAVLPWGGTFLGLPGNPISTVVGARFFLRPLLGAMRAEPPEEAVRLPLADAVRTRPDLRHFLRVGLRGDRDGGVLVHPHPRQQSFRIAPLLEANAWAVVPEGVATLPAGARVEVRGLEGRLFSCISRERNIPRA